MKLSSWIQLVAAVGAISVAAVASATDHETFTLATSGSLLDSDGTAATDAGANTHRTWNMVGGYVLGHLKFAGTFNKVNAGDFASESRFLITDGFGHSDVINAGAGLPGTYSTQQTINVSSFVGGSGSTIGADTWNLRAYESFDDGGVGSVDKQYNSLSVTSDDNAPTAPDATDLGNNPALTTSYTAASGQIKWYKFTTTTATDATKFINIDTGGSNLGGGITTNDTMLGVYTQSGALVDYDDDGLSGFLSLMDFGAGGSYGDLAAGTYYLATTQYPSTFGTSLWVVSTTATGSGDYVINFTNNLGGGGGGGSTITGTVTLNDYVVDPSGTVCHYTITDPNEFGAIQEEGDVTLDAGGAYTIHTNLSAGMFDVRMKGPHWLTQFGGNHDFSASFSQNFALTNGDCDGDDEVAPGDFGILSFAYGSVDGDPNWDATADLDGDGEVGPNDFGILSGHYGETGN